MIADYQKQMCEWLARLIARNEHDQAQRDLIYIKRHEVDNLRRDALAKGYDPYNTVDLLPAWIRIERRNPRRYQPASAYPLYGLR